MFFRKKQKKLQEKQQSELLSKRKALLDQKRISLDSVLQSQESLYTSVQTAVAAFESNTERILATLQKQEMSFEDVIERIEEQENQETVSKKRITELEMREQALLDVLISYQEQLFHFEHMAESLDENWKKQLAMVQDKLTRNMLEAGIQEIRGEGEPVNYELHEIIQVIDTEDEKLASKVSIVYRPGILYCGQVKRKARVLVYRLGKISNI